MNTRLFSTLGAIALLALTACTNPNADTEAPPAADMPDDTEVSPPDTEMPTMAIAEGVSLSADGSTLVMEEFSMLEAYCMDGAGKLAISYVGEEPGSDDQLVSCGPTFEGFDRDRETGFEGVNVVTPAIAAAALQLNAGEYTRVQCLSNQTSLEPVASDATDGHMTLNCL